MVEHFTVLTFLDDLCAAAAQNVKGVALISFLHDSVARAEPAHLQAAQQIADFVGRQRREDGAKFEEVANGSIGDVFLKVIAQFGMLAQQAVKIRLVQSQQTLFAEIIAPCQREPTVTSSPCWFCPTTRARPE